MEKNNILVDLGKISGTMLETDLKNPVQIRYQAVLDHDIDDHMIKEAWERTKRVYPLIDAVLAYEHLEHGMFPDIEAVQKYGDDHLYLVQADGGANHPVKTRVPVRPGTDAVGRRLICISYFERTVTISTFHILTDGSGISMIFSTFLYSYLALYTGHEDARPPVELREGRSIKEYYNARFLDTVFSAEYTPTPIYTLPLGCRGFFDEDMVNDENIYVGSLHVSAEDLIRCCKENGANPSSLLCALSAKAAYHINAGKKDDVVVSLTMALKKMFGLEETISNAVRLSLSYASYDDVMNKPISAAAQKIRKDMDLQRSKDYIVSFCRLFETYQYIPQVRPRVVTYIGNFDIGDNTKHIVDFNMETEGHFVVYTIQLRDQFVFVVQYGKATEKYLNEFDRLFKEMGIRSEISSPVHTVLKDVREAVL